VGEVIGATGGTNPGGTIVVGLIAVGVAAYLYLNRRRLADRTTERNLRLGPDWSRGFSARYGRPFHRSGLWMISVVLGIFGLVVLAIGLSQAVG
jgi:LPXTG-motif cell wall-anchored protein